MFTSKVKRQLLFCPGPVNVAENVKTAVYNEIGHREKDFSKILESLKKKTLMLFETKNPSNYHPVFITGSGTAANETVLSSVTDNSKVLVISNGEFGERLYDISSLHNKNTTLLRFEWDETLDLKIIKKTINSLKPGFVVMVHHETSTGMLNPIEKVGKLTKKYNIKFIVDAISSLGAERIDLDLSNIAFLTSSSGKALASLPGIGIIIGKHSEFKKVKDIKPKSMYLNLYKLYIYSITLSQTPNTPAVQLFCALEQAVTNIMNEDAECRRDYIRTQAENMRTGLKKLGLEFLIEENQMCSVLTTIKLPKYMNFKLLKEKLLSENIVIYNGKGPLEDKVFQVATIGQITPKDVQHFLKKLEFILMGKTHYSYAYAKNISFTPKLAIAKHSQINHQIKTIH